MSTSKITKPTLTAAQIMADLDSLNNCDPSAAIALLNASKNLSPREIRRRSRASILPEPPKFDGLGRRIVVPALSRLNSESDAESRNQRGSGSSSLSGNKGPGLDGLEEVNLLIWYQRERS
ncbi:hypothetical protein D0Z07_2821 [Hyphodiscus hymeniophilus]|uniref:Uncharacterized protein n=1 Tax=Hyphodiscus hymeniophilus TaxID=353542 RepID=A0A9P6VNH8_9HELO|nr:hypothetical protein D0Z07_2821 [Hyphodiscus hymeniophilus]